MENIKNFYFIGNAHIDPVWQWRWQEGSCEAKGTIRSALDRMKEYPEFIFVCGASQVFEWIEEFDPDMFDEIRQRVKEGRFVIVNGWFVQPDCNLPRGEGFARQSLYGQRYFYDKFGVTAKTGYNVDSFGHNAMLPQILKKSGMDQYVALRPGVHEKTLPSHVVRWRSPDGSEVIFARILRAYQTTYMIMNAQQEVIENADNAENMYGFMEQVDAQASPDCDSTFFFYGVGNHGGGPTKKNIESILELQKTHPELNLVFSNTEDFFDEMRKRYDQLPVVEDDLQHHASGCYSVVNSIKDGVRKAEWAMFSAENYNMLAKSLLGKSGASNEEFAKAWKNILFAHFHDAMGGCSAKAVYEDSDIFLKETRAMAQRTENNALQSIVWKIDTSDREKGIPIIVFNPHPFPIEPLVTVNNRIEVLYDSEGNEIPTQIVRSPDSRCRKRIGDTIFKAKIPALGYATYYFHARIPEEQFTPHYFPDAMTKPAYESEVSAKSYTLENEHLKVTFEKHSGYISSMFHKKTGKELLNGKGAVPVVIDEYGYDTWAHGKKFWNKQIGQFSDAEFTILESGPVRAKIKVVSRYNDSTLTQYFTLHQGSENLEVSAKIDWNEQHKMLKLRFDTAYTEDPHAFYEIPYGVFERPADGEEEPGQSWIAVKQGSEGLALLNDNKYSFSILKNQMNLSVVRSPYYIDHGRGDQNDSESEFTDQGEHSFRYALMPFTGDGWSKVTQAARLWNQSETVITENNHPGFLPDRCEGLVSSEDNVIVSAFKRSEDGRGIVLRAYETDGKQTEVTFSGSLLPTPLTAVFKPFSINTYFLADGETEWEEVLITEFPQ